MSETFERWVHFEPSRNWIRDTPSRNYGITTASITFFVRGPKGVVQWKIGTEWGIKSVRDHLAKFSVRNIEEMRMPSGWDLGYHSYRPMYEGQEPLTESCPILNGDRCYYNGSSLNADYLIEGFLAGGTDWLWPKLEEVYRAQFEDGPEPDFTPPENPHPDDRAKAEITP